MNRPARRMIWVCAVLLLGALTIGARADQPTAAPATQPAMHGADHWAFKKPTRPLPPTTANKTWRRNEIDDFILARLEKEGLAPAPTADRVTLIRRVSLDLIGLPPTPAEVDAFISDKSPDAYEKLVDRLLASPHYGERWAMPWLDLARYADSEGYERDPLRSMWPYRDWVIKALNDNMPFDEFTIEQLAGDLLPNATIAQKVATGFHRNTMINREAGSDQGEFFYYALVDRVNTTATVWLGATIGCAQCHDHKYDPFTMKDYYRLMAFFNGTAEEAKQVGGSEISDISPRVTVELPAAKDVAGQIAEQEHALEQPSADALARQAEWEKSAARDPQWTPLDIVDASATNGATLKVLPDGSILSGGALPGDCAYTIVAHTALEHVNAIQLEVLPDDSFPSHGPGRAFNGNFALSHLEMTAKSSDENAKARVVPLRNASADVNQEGWPVEAAISPRRDPNTGWAVLPEIGKRHFAIFETGADAGLAGGTTLTFTLDHRSTAAQHLIGRLRLSVTQAKHPPAALPEKIGAILAIDPAQRSADQSQELAGYYRSISPEVKAARARIDELKKRLSKMTATVLVMQELPEPRETRMHVRGAYLSTGEKVEPATPAILTAAASSNAQAADSARRPTRLDLARWLVNPENPLTARVAVNRMWEQYFGTGIIKTSEDFGTQGERPTHPELLDWLACQFMSRGWDMKQMHRLIVMSATYCQSSSVTPELLEKDPYNRLLARGPRFRLPAEMIRDQALAAGGLLSEKIGGPSVFPVQPDGVWNTPYAGERWETSPGEDRYRRGLYTFIRRSVPYPQFIAFDMTSHEAICTRRSRTNTPLQALTTLNDPALIQAAAALARKSIAEADATPEARATYIFRRVLARAPETIELKRLLALREELMAKYSADEAAAKKIAQGSLPDLPSKWPVAEMATWTMVANVVLNLDETLTKG